jgi:hypothetical protein
MTKLTPTFTQSRLLAALPEDDSANPLWTGDVISQRPPFLFIRIQQLVAIATLGFLFWLWFGVSTSYTPRASYPYYDIQKPVPPWSEPAPLAGNYGREGEYR